MIATKRHSGIWRFLCLGLLLVSAQAFAQRYGLTLAVDPPGSGTIQTFPAPGGDGKYAAGTEVTLTASPVRGEGYAFDFWTGDAAGTTPSVNVVMDNNRFVTANFLVALMTISPAYGDEWLPGTLHNIEWVTDPAVPIASVKIKLFRDNAFLRWITGGTPNDGSFAWTVPLDLPADATEDLRYTFQIYAVDNFGILDYSDPFAIRPSAMPILYPNGGEEVYRNGVYTITWTPVPGYDTVKLKLWRGNQVYQWISAGTLNNGSFRWTVPAGIPDGINYRVQIYAATDFQLLDFSDNTFSIAASPLQIAYPNGGQVLHYNSPVNVTWDDPVGVGAQVKIKLWRNQTFVQWISGGTGNDGSFQWIVPASLTPASNYVIQIYSANDYRYVDYSDAPFTIAP